MVYLSLYGLVALGFGLSIRPEINSWSGWGIAALWAAFWPLYLILIGVFMVLAKRGE